jgi:hypothetical protein
MAPLRAEMAGHLEYVTAAGGRLPADPAAVAEAMISLMSGYAYTWLTGGGAGSGPQLTADEAVDLVSAFIYSGIMGQPPGDHESADAAG